MSTTTSNPDVTMQVTDPPTNDVDNEELDVSQQVFDSDQGTHDVDNEVVHSTEENGAVDNITGSAVNGLQCEHGAAGITDVDQQKPADDTVNHLEPPKNREEDLCTTQIEDPLDQISRRSTRPKVLTTKGRQYAKDQAVTAFKNSIKSLKCKNTQALTMMSGAELDILQLYNSRDNLETIANELSVCYYNLDTLDLLDFREQFDECTSRNAATMFNLTQAIRALENPGVHGNPMLNHGAKSHRSMSSKSSICSMHSGLSTASMKAEAAAKAAALRAKLKFHDTEIEQKAQLAKTRLLRDLEVEEAKFAAISQVESGANISQINDNVVVANPEMPPVVPQLQDNNVSRIVLDNSVANVDPIVSIAPIVSNSKVASSATVRTLNSNAPEFIPKPSVTQKPAEMLDSQPSSVPQLDREQTTNVAPNSSNSFVSDVTAGLNNLVGSLNDFVSLSRVPVPEPGIFEGNPIEYSCWRSSLRLLIERKSIPPAEYIHYLKGCIGGKAKQCVAGFLQIPTEESFNEAMSLLDRRYGNLFVVAQAFKTKLQEWPKIGSRDNVGLQAFSDFLCQCEVAARSNESLRVLDDDLYNNELVLKLPDWLSARWAREVHKARVRQNSFPKFVEFVNFIRNEADIACEPIMTSKSNLSNGSHKSVKLVGNSLNTVAKPTVSEGSEKCMFCDETNHELEQCEKLKSNTADEKSVFIRQKGLCFGCLRRGHMSRDCKMRLQCNVCGKRHPTVLHNEESETPTTGFGKSSRQSEGKRESTSKHVSMLTHDTCTSKSTMVLPVYLSHGSNPHREVLTYALLDTQSDTSFVSEEIAADLGVRGVETTLVLSTMTAENLPVKSARIAGLSVRGHDSQKTVSLPPLYTTSNIPVCSDSIPTPDVVNGWPYLRPLAKHLMPKSDVSIGLLIGYNCPQALVPREVIAPVGNGPFGQKTDLGWGVVGLISNVTDSDPNVGISHHVCSEQTGSHIVLRTTAKELISPSDILQFFNREVMEPVGDKFSQDELMFLNLMQEGVRKLDDGHYELPLPLRNPSVPPIFNRSVAFHRLKALVKKFGKDPQHYEHYKAFMEALFEKGYAEEVPKSEITHNTNCYYLPHHGVYSPSKPGKVRVVMDGSAKYQGQSLNDQLLKGPDLMNTLLGVLCRFRRESVALTCDIEAMFQQFKVPIEQRNYLRFLWFSEHDYSNKPTDYRSTVHLFGAASSPAVANFALKRAAADNKDKFKASTIKFIQQDFYVDDGLTSVSSVTEAIKLIEESIQLTSQCGLKLQKFVCNSREVLESIDIDLRANAFKDIDLNLDPLSVERALGVSWCVESDQFKFRVVVQQRAMSRRGILSTVCSIFDPLGLIAPVVLQGKMILQALCKDQLGWDDPLPDNIRSQWEMWLHGLSYLKDFGVDRCCKPKNFAEIKVCELHNFSDACFSGYGQCSYLRLIDEGNIVHCTLVLGKSRVAPLRTISIPRLELMAAVLSADVSSFLARELDYDQLKQYFWTDSKIVLGFIASDSKRFHTFVANRVQQIRDVSSTEQWQHVTSEENPADLASRGTTGEQLLNSFWFRGPSFLWDVDQRWNSTEVFDLDPSHPDIKTSTCLAIEALPTLEVKFPLKYTTWNHVKRVIAICIRFVDNLKSKKRGPINVADLERAQHVLVSSAQLERYSDAIKKLKSSKPVGKSCRLLKLDPFLDDQGIIRVGGRLRHSEMPVEMKHPIILPKAHIVTSLVVQHHHERVQHQGKGITVNSVRSQFWVQGLSQIVSKLLYNCATCRRQRHAPLAQKMNDLPFERMDSVPAFTHVGVDLFGPFYIKERRKEIKRYGVMFTCLSSRAIHLETANSLDTDSFVNALRRFLSIRGPVRTLRSDQGTNIIGGINQLQSAGENIEDEQVKRFLLDNACDYIPNVPNASHQGGVWERQIRTARSVLSSLLTSQGIQLDDEGLRTLMCETANIVNSRPLTLVTLNDPTAPEPITPNHLLTMKCNFVLPPPGEFQEADKYARNRWKRVQYLSDLFWRRWRHEFLTQLQERQKWTKTYRNVQQDDIVMIVDDSLPRCQWKLGRIVETYADPDGLIRKAKLQVGDPALTADGKPHSLPKFLERPIHKLVLLAEGD